MAVTLRAISIALLAAALALPSLQASAQEYPSRPVRLIVPLGAGGPNDLVGRWLLAYPALVPFDVYRRSHFAHHRE